MAMISREEVEQRYGEIVKDGKNTYTVKKPETDELLFVCKYCGTELQHNEMFKHFNLKHPERCEEWAKEHIAKKEREKELANSTLDDDIDEYDMTESEENTLTRERVRKPRSTPRRVLTPEEEMLEEMAKTLRVQLESTPGIGAGPKTDWFVEQYFRNVKAVQENPQELFKVLKRYFPKADDDAISLIVSSVFKVRETYMKASQGFGFTPPQQPQFPQRAFPQYPTVPQPQGSDGMVGLMFTMMQQMMQQQQQFYQMLLQEAKNKVDPQAIKAEVENEYLKRQLERLEEQLDRMMETITDNRSRSISPEGWKDDYARLIAEMGDKILSLGERIIVENKKFRQTLVKYLAPRMFGEKEEFEPAGEGRTDEEILKALEGEDFVEGEA